MTPAELFVVTSSVVVVVGYLLFGEQLESRLFWWRMRRRMSRIQRMVERKGKVRGSNRTENGNAETYRQDSRSSADAGQRNSTHAEVSAAVQTDRKS